MRRLISHCKKWNCWRKYNDNTGFHKLLVLFKIVKSPTFEEFVDGEILVAIFKAYAHVNENDPRKENDVL